MSEDVFDDEHYAAMKKELKTRVGGRRYKHSKGVAKTAESLARAYGCDPAQARMAGLIHDWDKGLTLDEVRQRAIDLGVKADPAVIDDMPWLLHGPTAAAALKRDYPEFGQEVFQAIARHTSGAVDMAPLDCIIYVADIIEPNRVYDDPEGLAALREAAGTVPLENLYFLAFKFTFEYLVAHDRQLFPDTVNIWNALMWKYGKARELAL